VDGERIASIDAGLLVFAAVGVDDTREDREWIARKVVDLRIFDDPQGVMNRSVIDARGNVLAVSQFTLFGPRAKVIVRRGRARRRRMSQRRHSTISCGCSKRVLPYPLRSAASARTCRSPW
jgi:hypothetical protein